ncbi:MAG TPA: electron transfer flavoprotein subunit beta/FixA family protein [Thermomicrobiales bacterium]|nr:electron transfer flavoprotein subunit beta/FixA family protein [Thermomicrobiales bacterium]
MNIVVLVKQTPDMNAVKIDRASGKPVLSGQNVVSSYDAYAIEEALQLRNAHGGEAIVVTAGPASAKDAITRALAMGADRGVHIEIDDPNQLDTLALADLLAAQIRPLAADLILAGQTADDYESGQVGAEVAELLGVPVISNVVGLDVQNRRAIVRRDMEDGYQTVETPLPAVVLASTGLNEPRLPSLKGIMAAKKKPIERIAADAVPSANRATWSEPVAPERSARGVIVQDQPAAEAADRLIGWLQEHKLI